MTGGGQDSASFVIHVVSIEFPTCRTPCRTYTTGTNGGVQHLEQGSDIGAAFFDFKKAFDSVTLISKLQQLNLDPNIVSSVTNYLSDRTNVYTEKVEILCHFFL